MQIYFLIIGAIVAKTVTVKEREAPIQVKGRKREFIVYSSPVGRWNIRVGGWYQPNKYLGEY